MLQSLGMRWLLRWMLRTCAFAVRLTKTPRHPSLDCSPDCRLAAQQLGMFALVAELQEAWAAAEAAWQSLPPARSQQPEEGEEARQEVQGQQAPFQEAVLAASQAWAANSNATDDSSSGSHAGLLLGVLEGAGPLLEAMGLDDFPRLLTWSEGLCGLTLMPLRCGRATLPWPSSICSSMCLLRRHTCTCSLILCPPNSRSLPPFPLPLARSLFDGHLPAAPWLEGRPCLVPLANLWLHCVSPHPPQLD